jgi:hypothetical protein
MWLSSGMPPSPSPRPIAPAAATPSTSTSCTPSPAEQEIRTSRADRSLVIPTVVELTRAGRQWTRV